MRSPAQCHWDLLDTRINRRSVADIHATPGLRHLYCRTFPRFAHSRESFMPFDFFPLLYNQTWVGTHNCEIGKMLELPVCLFKLVGNKRTYVGLRLLRARQRATALVTTIFRLSRYKRSPGTTSPFNTLNNGNIPLFIALQGSYVDTKKFLTLS